MLAARSAPVGASRNPGLLVRGSGTSFATPHVTGAVALCFEAAGNRLSAHEIRSLVLGSCDPVPDSDPQCRLGRGYLNIPRLVADLQQALAAPAAPGAKEPTMDTEDAIVLLAAAPATAYREYLYRPRGQLARWIDDRYDVVARPGQRVARPLQRGDLLIEVALGSMDRGRYVNLDGPELAAVGSRPWLPQGQLILRPLPRVEMSEPMPVEPADEVESAGLDRLVDQGLSENQITDALFYARHPRQSGAMLRADTHAAREWQSLRDLEVRPGVRQRLAVSPIDPVQLAVFLSQYENDSRVPAEYTKRFLTGTPLLSMARTLRDRVIGNWRGGGRPLTALGLYELALETAGDPPTAELLCHNVTKAFVREGIAITWHGTGTEGEYTDGQKTYTAKVINSAGQLKYHRMQREVTSIFYVLFLAREFGTDDPGDWYHYFVTATMAALAGSGTLGPTSGRGRSREDVEGDAEERGGRVGTAMYRGLLSDRVADLEKQMTDPALAPVPGYRGWVLANVLSFLEGGHYGADYTTGQSDVVRESQVHLRGAAFGLRTIGGSPGKTWRWYMPIAGSLSDADLAIGFTLKDKTAEVWGSNAKPAVAEAANADGAFEDYDSSAEGNGGVEPHVKAARETWAKLFGRDNTLKKVTILDYEHVPSDAVKELGYGAWTNSVTRIYIAESANADPFTLEATLRHEAVHVQQFAKDGRPKSYEKMAQYELKAYRDSVAFVQPRCDALESVKNRSKAQDEELKKAQNVCTTFQAAVDQLDEGIQEGAKQPKASGQRERWYRHFLVSHCFLPYHRTLLDLYEPPKELKNPTAQEAVTAYGDEGWDQDGVEAYNNDGSAGGAWTFPAETGTVSGLPLEGGSLADGADLVGGLFTEGFADSPQDAAGEWPQDTGQFSPAEFTGPEHKTIGDAGSGRESSSIPYGNPPEPLTFGDVVSMAGDYFETYEQMRDLGTTAEGRAELEWARWRSLDLKAQGMPEPQATDPGTTKKIKKNATDRYLLLAARNLSHFSAGGTAWQAYSLWHGKAIADALEAGQTSDQAVWRRALTKEAFGDHFLTDMFSAGHVRTPRAEIRDWYDRHFPGTSEKLISYMARYIFDRLDERQQLPPLLWWVGWITKSIMADRIRVMGGEAVNSFSLGDIVSLALHNQDNKRLVVVSEVNPEGQVVPGGYTWTAVGDGHLGRSAQGAQTKAMATAGVIASLRDLERIRGVGVKLGSSPATLAQKTDEIRKTLGPAGFAARAFVPHESKVPGANLPLTCPDGTRAPLEWRWGQLGDAAFGAVDETVKAEIAGELHEMATTVQDPINAGLGMRVYGTRNAFLSFVRHLHTDGIAAIEKAVGKSAR